MDTGFFKGYGMIRSHIGSTQEWEVVLEFERFSHLFGWYFGLGSPIGLDLIISYPLRNQMSADNIHSGLLMLWLEFTPNPPLGHRVIIFLVEPEAQSENLTQNTGLIGGRTSQA